MFTLDHESWHVLAGFPWADSRLGTLYPFLIQSSDHPEARAMIIPILQVEFRTLEAKDLTAESRAWPLHHSYK